MGNVHINNTSQNRSYDYVYDYNSIFKDFDLEKLLFIINVVTYIIICIGLPLTLVAIYALYSLVRKDNVAPIYVINLLISDIIQFCCMIVFVAKPVDDIVYIIGGAIYDYSLMASVGFMVCIALERYLVIACPLWYRFRRTIKSSVVVCVLVWILPLVCFFFAVIYICYSKNPLTILTIVAIFFLLPLPLFIFSLVGTLKAMSACSSVPADGKRRIVAMLVLVLLIYTLLFLPIIILLLNVETGFKILGVLPLLFYRLSPLADLVLYVFMRKGVVDKLLASVCCFRMDSNDDNMVQLNGFPKVI